MLKMLPFHVAGGMEWMLPLSFLLLILLGMIVYVSSCLIRGRKVSIKWPEIIKHTGMLALAWGVLATISGLYFMFKSLQSLNQVPSHEMMMGGLQVLLIALLYALMIFIISLIAYLLLRLKMKHHSSWQA